MAHCISQRRDAELSAEKTPVSKTTAAVPTAVQRNARPTEAPAFGLFGRARHSVRAVFSFCDSRLARRRSDSVSASSSHSSFSRNVSCWSNSRSSFLFPSEVPHFQSGLIRWRAFIGFSVIPQYQLNPAPGQRHASF